MAQYTNFNKILKRDISGKKILVVGGRGFIGRALVRRLVNLTAEVVSISKRNENANIELVGVKQVTVDICNSSELIHILSGQKFDYVFNLGGYIDHSPFLKGNRNVIDTHYIGTINLLENVYHSDLKCFVQVGSSDEYGNAPAPQKENIREAPISQYSAAKTGITHLIQALARTENFPGVVVRFFLVYGPGQRDQRFLSQIIYGCLKDIEFPTSLGAQLRDFCYIEDAIEGMILCAVKPKAIGHVINIASGRPISIRKVIKMIVELVGKGRPNFGKYPYRPGENMELYADVALAKNLINWQATTSIEDGLIKTITWYMRR